MADPEREISVAIVGGGQLGMMLVEASAALSCRCEVLAGSAKAPASRVAPVVVGDVQSAEDVARFGEGHDVVTIELEAVSVEGLRRLQKRGVKVYPQPDVVALIQDKGAQKRWLAQQGFPTAAFALYEDAEAIRRAVAEGERALPFVQKVRRAGYDGRGVKVVGGAADLEGLLEGPSVAEDRVAIAQELGVVVARSEAGEVAVYEPVEMVFRERDNILDLLVCPARLAEARRQQARQLAASVTEALGIVGLLAVEMFVEETGALLVNELAPRPHNSGHHTIESCVTSQYQQHLRAICGKPLGDTSLTSAAVMVNVLGAPGHRGAPVYVGIEEVERAPGAHLHLYGKEQTWPMRKMGHLTVCDAQRERALEEARRLREALRVESAEGAS